MTVSLESEGWSQVYKLCCIYTLHKIKKRLIDPVKEWGQGVRVTIILGEISKIKIKEGETNFGEGVKECENQKHRRSTEKGAGARAGICWLL